MGLPRAGQEEDWTEGKRASFRLMTVHQERLESEQGVLLCEKWDRSWPTKPKD